MGRNDPCFCGSNKKTKKCHPNIHKDSLAAKVIKSHNIIDEIIENHQNTIKKNNICHAGCYECCYGYFPITDCEFYIILNEVNNWDDSKKQKIANRVHDYMEIFKSEHPDIYNYLNTDHTGDNNILLEMNNLITKTSFPCIFLNEETKKCEVYQSRPQICRSYGDVMQITEINTLDLNICNSLIYSKIGKYKDADWLVNIEFIDGNVHDYDSIYLNDGRVLKTKKYPILYLLYSNLFLRQLNFKIPSNREILLFSISENEYIKRTRQSLGIKD